MPKQPKNNHPLTLARVAAGLTQPQAAARCGVSFSAWEKWERGSPISRPTLAGCILLLGLGERAALKAARQAAG